MSTPFEKKSSHFATFLLTCYQRSFILKVRKEVIMSFHERLKEARLAKGLTQQEVANRIGVAKSTYSGYESGFREPDVLKIKKLINTLGCTSSYLLGDIEKHAPKDVSGLTSDEKHFIDSFRLMDAHGRKVVIQLLQEEVNRITAPVTQSEQIEMIVYNFPAAAGIPLYAEDDSYERLEFPASTVPAGADFGIRVSGDSMEPTIPAGAIVFVRKTGELRPGDIGIFMIDDEAVCKRFSMDQRGFVLLPDNPAYPEILIKDFQRFAITGKVLGYK
jgi:repressor LexA